MDRAKLIKIIFAVTGVIISACVGVFAYKVFAQKDVLVSSEAWCDPETEGPCYVWVCEPDWGTECAGDPEEDVWIYKLIEKKAHDMPACEPVVRTKGFFTKVDEIIEPCPEQECIEGDSACETIYCDPSIGEDCYNEEAWDDYVATLRDNLDVACNNGVGDYLNVPDYCALVEQMDAASLEEQGASETVPNIEEDIELEEEGTL